MCCPSLDCKTWICKDCYDSYDDYEVHHVEIMNNVVIADYMNENSDDECIEACYDAEEESDGSEESIVNEYEGG